MADVKQVAAEEGRRAIMDCVGCEKCRLWGKLQILGLGTALKILFSVDEEQGQEQGVRIFAAFPS
eukprot:jgi/Mesen1/283/ME1155523C09450